MLLRTYIFIFLNLLSLAGSLFAQKKNYEICGIAFYNLENLFDIVDDPKKFDEDFTPTGLYKYTEKIYHKKLHNLSQVIAQLGKEYLPEGPALIGIAEVENEKVIQDLISQPKLKDRKYKIVHFESPDSRGIDVALLYRPDIFKLIMAQSLPVLLNQKNSKEKTRDILYVKGLLGKDTFHIFVNHWPSRRGGEAASSWKRMTAANVCRNKIDEILDINLKSKIIVMGDFNDDPINQSIIKGLKASTDKKQIQDRDLFNPWASLYKKGIGTLGYNDSWNLFDQIILSKSMVDKNDIGWKLHKAEVFKKSFIIQQFGKWKGYPHRSFSGTQWIDGYSDHFPTLVYLRNQID